MNRKKYQIVFVLLIFIFTLTIPCSLAFATNEDELVDNNISIINEACSNLIIVYHKITIQDLIDENITLKEQLKETKQELKNKDEQIKKIEQEQEQQKIIEETKEDKKTIVKTETETKAKEQKTTSTQIKKDVKTKKEKEKTKVVEKPIEIEQEPIVTNYYSNSIKVKVTDKQKKEVNEKVKKYDNEIKMLAKLVYREARGMKTTKEKAAVVWCVLNRVDNKEYGNSISKVIKEKHQFAWVPNTPVTKELYNLSKDVVTRWLLEKQGCKNVGRVLPKSYLFFAGRNGKNYFRKTYKSRSYWNWSLASPY